MSIQLPKGTFDILPYSAEELWQETHLWHYLESTIASVMRDFGYLEIRTPIYERTELFDRSVGETTDIVSKEMFTFQDKGGRSLSLRPEGTASVMRSFIEHHLAQSRSTHKLYYIGPMFRYERPQSGRYRQFHQLGVEAIGVQDPAQDAEIIDVFYQICRALGLTGLKVRLNTVGDAESRSLYRDALLSYFRPYLASLSSDSQVRFEKNPLRILDSKDPKDMELVKGAPSILDHLSASAKNHFEEVCRLLDLIRVPYHIDHRIVRGLDYYTKTVFEITAEGIGAQNAVGGGGRYDHLLKSLGGPDLPGVGFAAGLERVLQVLLAQKIEPGAAKGPLIYFIPLGDEAKTSCFQMASWLRRHKIPAEVELHAKKVQTGMQNAIKAKAIYSTVIGSDELGLKRMELKHLENRQTTQISFDDLLSYLQGVKP